MISVQEHVALARFSNFKIGGEARYFFEAKSAEEIAEAADFARGRGLPVFVLGGGTNLLISDRGFPGLVLKPSLADIRVSGTEIAAGAGVLMGELLAFAAAHDLRGLEWAGGLPGTLGGAIRGNAGCFGGETKDAVSRATSFDFKTSGAKTRTNAECEFGYRTSIFKTGARNEIILEAALALSPGDRKEIEKSAAEKISYRAARHPLEYPNIGSIFKNVPLESIPEHTRGQFLHIVKTDPFPVVPAAYLISEAGLKGISVEHAVVSPKHPNFIVNTGGAREKDVSELIQKVKDAVQKKFFIALEEEVQRVG